MHSWKKKRLFLSAFNYRANKKKSGKRSLSLLVIDQQASYQTVWTQPRLCPTASQSWASVWGRNLTLALCPPSPSSPRRLMRHVRGASSHSKLLVSRANSPILFCFSHKGSSNNNTSVPGISLSPGPSMLLNRQSRNSRISRMSWLSLDQGRDITIYCFFFLISVIVLLVAVIIIGFYLIYNWTVVV